MNVWQAVAAALAAEKTPIAFGIPGGDRFFDSIRDNPEIRKVLVRDPRAAPFMAMGYARVSGRPAVCYSVAGPGVALLVPGILEAYAACQPVIAIVSSSKRANAGQGALQEYDQVGVMRPITKWAERVTEPERIWWVMRKAFSMAMNGKPGPVFIDIPKDVGMVEIEPRDYIPAAYPIRTAGDPERTHGAIELLRAAQRPVVVVGGGGVSSRAFDEVRRFAELAGAPVLTSPGGRGILAEDHPLACGLVGLYFSELGQQVYSQSDLLITLGSRNEDFQSGEQKFFPRGARYIQVDIDPDEIGRNWPADVPIVGDVRLVLNSWIDELEGNPLSAAAVESRAVELAAAKRAFLARVDEDSATDEVPLKTKRVLRELNEVLGPNTILVNENGSLDLWSYSWPYFKVLDTNTCVAPGEQTCMGGGCAAAIGAKLALPDRNVVCPTGDGAFQMFTNELATAVQYGAPVLYLVLNNRSLGWIKFHQRNLGDRFVATDFEVQPDFMMVAEANQCFGVRIERPEEIRPALERALAATRAGTPAVVECIVDGWDFSFGFNNYYERMAHGGELRAKP
jgi:acetolactate synthase-1/2/3 large subunit